MNRILKFARIFSAVFALTGSPALAQDAARSLMAVDISGSSTFLVDQNSADDAGEFVEKYIAGLEAPHDLYMVSVGDVGRARRVIDVRATVTKTRASSARKLAKQFGAFFRSLPSISQRGDLKAQGTTSLVAFLRSLKPLCAGGASVMIFSDGIEFSSKVDGNAFAAGKVSLPKPDSAFLTGCSVTMLGIGQVKSTLSSDGLEERLAPEWEKFLADAGANPIAVRGAFFAF